MGSVGSWTYWSAVKLSGGLPLSSYLVGEGPVGRYCGFFKLGRLSGLMSYISPCCFALLVCAEDLLGRLTFPLLGGGLLFYISYRLSWDLDLCGRGLEGFLMGRKVVCMWDLT